MNKIATLSFGLFLVFGISIIFNSCAKEGVVEVKEEPDVIVFPEPTEIIQTTLYGKIVNANNEPVSGASITCYSCLTEQTNVTDTHGNFLFQDIQNKGVSAYLVVENPGMFKAFRRMGVIENKFNYTEIQLNEKTSIGEVNSEDGGTLEHSSGASVTLPSNGVINQNGSVYSGSYEVFIAWIKPDADNLSQNMVGDLSGIDNTGAMMALSTYGMLVVELLDEDGNELNLGEGFEAELKFPVPASMLDNAPSTIPLWSYDEDHGYWVEESSADLEGAFYIGKVSHFSSWNVDFKGEAIDISGTVLVRNLGNNLGASYYQILISSDFIGSRGGWLCDDGTFVFLNTPANETFTITIIDYCGKIVFQEEYGPFSEDTVLPTIVVSSLSSNRNINVKGNAVDCDGNPVTNGYAFLSYDSGVQIFPILPDGSFEFLATSCSDENTQLTIYNADVNYESDPLEISDLETNFEFIDIRCCVDLGNNTEEEYLYISIDNYYENSGVGDITFQEGIASNAIINRLSDNSEFGFQWKKPVDGEISEGISIIITQAGTVQSIAAENIQFITSDFEFPSVAKGVFFGFVIIDNITYKVNGGFNVK